jgi:hypothetical protein
MSRISARTRWCSSLATRLEATQRLATFAARSCRSRTNSSGSTAQGGERWCAGRSTLCVGAETPSRQAPCLDCLRGVARRTIERPLCCGGETITERPLWCGREPLLTGDQIDARSAFAAACSRSLTSASSRAARSIRSCWVLTSSCWLSARARSDPSWSAICLTVRVRSANWPATLAMSSWSVTSARFYAGEPG